MGGSFGYAIGAALGFLVGYGASALFTRSPFPFATALGMSFALLLAATAGAAGDYLIGGTVGWVVGFVAALVVLFGCVWCFKPKDA